MPVNDNKGDATVETFRKWLTTAAVLVVAAELFLAVFYLRAMLGELMLIRVILG